MIRPTSIDRMGPATGTRKAATTAGNFRADLTGGVQGNASAAPAAPSDILGALIELQGVAARDQDRRQKIAAAQWALSLLDRLRVSLLDGTQSDADLEALAAAAAPRGPCDSDVAVQSALDEIAVRARVELAKRGR
ncbi:MAG: flagellar assembly protein FliX [Parvularculaceae bacterium]